MVALKPGERLCVASVKVVPTSGTGAAWDPSPIEVEGPVYVPRLLVGPRLHLLVDRIDEICDEICAVLEANLKD